MGRYAEGDFVRTQLPTQFHAKMVLLVQFALTWMLVGLIWFVQLVHYPLMSDVGAESFVKYETLHREFIGPLVAPLMLAEGLSALLLVVTAKSERGRWKAWLGIVLLIVIWGSTFFWQVPLHERLMAGFDEAVHAELVHSNWIRTLAWTARGVVLFAVVSQRCEMRHGSGQS